MPENMYRVLLWFVLLWAHYSTLLTHVHDDVIKWKHFPRWWPFVGGIHRSSANSPHKGQWRGAFLFTLICAWTNSWVNNRDTGDLNRHRAHYDVTVINCFYPYFLCLLQQLVRANNEETSKLRTYQTIVWQRWFYMCKQNVLLINQGWF